MHRDQFQPDYTPFSQTGSAYRDGDRRAEEQLSPSHGLAVLILLFALIIGAILW